MTTLQNATVLLRMVELLDLTFWPVLPYDGPDPLTACASCGATPELHGTLDKKYPSYLIACPTCGLWSGNCQNVQDAVTLWNSQHVIYVETPAPVWCGAPYEWGDEATSIVRCRRCGWIPQFRFDRHNHAYLECFKCHRQGEHSPNLVTAIELWNTKYPARQFC